ncbi:MAG: PAS domain S-box protein [Candidatus Lokiarchaeota archaeon]|nr:PAS domain S-box protein [Candidatus Lokiarchaeota archaeon]MBD3342687.1 PAS domain S-box protein [Candidatus Lokiarchaeota archaeon]
MKNALQSPDKIEKRDINLIFNDLVFWIDDRFDIEKLFVGIFSNNLPELNFDCKNLLHNSVFNLIEELNHNHAKKFFKTVFKRGKDIIELLFKDKKGNSAWFEVRGKKLEGNSTESAFFCANNISKFKSREKELLDKYQTLNDALHQLKASNPELRFWKILYPQKCITAVQKTREMLETVIDAIPHYIYWKDVNLKYVGCNKNYARINGLDDPTTIIGKTDNDLPWASQNKDKISEIERKVINSNQPIINKIEEWKNSNGEKKFYNTVRIPLYKEKNQVIGVLTTYEDITDKIANERLIKESEEKYRGILENIKSGYFEVDMDGNFQVVNEAFCNLFNYQKNEIYDIHYTSLVDEKNRQKIVRDFDRVAETGEGITNFNFEGFTKNGDKIVAETSVYLRYKNGEKIGYYGLIRDITEKTILENKLIESEIRYRHLFNSSPYAIWLVDLRGTIIDCNDTMNKMLSAFTKDDLIGKKFIDVIKAFTKKGDPRFKELQKVFRERFKRLITQGYLEPLEFEVKRADGKILWLTLRTSFINIGKKRLVQVFIEDITQRKLAQKELENERHILKNIIERNPYGIAIFTKDGYYISGNKAYRNLFGSEPPEWYSVFDDKIAQKDGPVYDAVEKIKKGEATSASEVWFNPHTHVSKDLPYKDVCFKTELFPIHDKDGKFTRFVMMYEDITDKKLAEEELEELQRELEKRVKDRTIKLERSEKKYRMAYDRANCLKGLFTHDISNIFQTVANSIELCQMSLNKKMTPGDLMENFELIEQQIQRGKKLISNIRSLSEIEESEIALKKIDVFDNLRHAIKFLKVNFQDRIIKVNLESEENNYYIISNELLLDVFENILINAVRYNNNDNINIDIKISKVPRDGRTFVKFEFQDNGIGIEDSRKKLIFREKSKNDPHVKGMGLGLLMVAKLLELSEGKIWVEDRIKGDYTQGSNFVLLIPEA